MPLSNQNDGIECDEWVREAGLFRPLCGQPFFPSVGDDTCDVCVSPYVPLVPETPCSVRMLPDPAKTYYLAVDSPPFGVSFAYPTLSSWKSQTVSPFFVSGPEMNGPWPVNESVLDPLYGYRWDFNLGATGNVWGIPAITNVNPIVQPSYVINPGTEVTGGVPGFVGSRRVCRSNLIRYEVISQTELIRTSTVNPLADAIIKPQRFATRVRHVHAARVTQQISYFAHTAASPLDWDGPSTAYGIAMALAVEHFVIEMQAWYKQLNGSTPWGYPGSELYPYDFSPLGSFRNAFPPKAVCSRFYSFSTTDKTAFMSASSFVLTMTPPPSVIVAPAAYPMYDIDDHVTVRTFPETTDWIEAGYSPSDSKWDSTGPFEWQKVLHTNATGVFSSGWPTQIRVVRGAYS